MIVELFRINIWEKRHAISVTRLNHKKLIGMFLSFEASGASRVHPTRAMIPGVEPEKEWKIDTIRWLRDTHHGFTIATPTQ